MKNKAVCLDIRDNIAYITLNRPDAANSVDMEMATGLVEAATSCAEDRTVRAVMLTGTNGMFCSGGDLRGFAAEGDRLPYHLRMLTAYVDIAVSRFTRMDAPVVAEVNGGAAGVGLSMVCACDIVIAAKSARFSSAYTRAGLTPDGSLTYFLPRLVGQRRALELILTNRVLSAQEALVMGIVTQVVEDAELQSRAQALVTQLAAGPTKAFGMSKRLVHGGWTGTLETQMENESQSIAAAGRTADAQEGIRAFLEKQTPRYIGE
jgi:2-(1,2-epoxy-1,2-dihydrophenyl)acetyl-CoA isomerase